MYENYMNKTDLAANCRVVQSGFNESIEMIWKTNARVFFGDVAFKFFS